MAMNGNKRHDNRNYCSTIPTDPFWQHTGPFPKGLKINIKAGKIIKSAKRAPNTVNPTKAPKFLVT